jgi:hypothetical protein
MNKFGTVKTKVLQKITEAYANGDKKEIKNILTTIKKNSDFKGLYLFYEHVENKYMEDKEDAKLFVNSIVPLLQHKMKNVKSTSKILGESLKDISSLENTVYDDLDILAEEDSLLNQDKKIIAKLRLIEHLVTKKEEKETNIPVITNEALLHTILANNFNVLYDNTLNESEKKELSELLSISDTDLKTNFKTLQEEVTEKMNDLIKEEKNLELLGRLNEAHIEAGQLKPSKLNYYKLQQLKKGL